jgi:hypothetical protein
MSCPMTGRIGRDHEIGIDVSDGDPDMIEHASIVESVRCKTMIFSGDGHGKICMKHSRLSPHNRILCSQKFRCQ